MNTLLKAQSLGLALSLLLIGGAANASDLSISKTDSAKVAVQTNLEGKKRIPLTTDQLEKLSVLKNKLTLDTAEKKAELKVGRRQLFDLLSKPKVDKQEVLTLNSKLKALKGDISDSRLDFMLAASEVLTPEQKEQIHNRMLTRSLKGGFHRHHRFGGLWQRRRKMFWSSCK